MPWRTIRCAWRGDITAARKRGDRLGCTGQAVRCRDGDMGLAGGDGAAVIVVAADLPASVAAIGNPAWVTGSVKR